MRCPMPEFLGAASSFARLGLSPDWNDRCAGELLRVAKLPRPILHWINFAYDLRLALEGDACTSLFTATSPTPRLFTGR